MLRALVLIAAFFFFRIADCKQEKALLDGDVSLHEFSGRSDDGRTDQPGTRRYRTLAKTRRSAALAPSREIASSGMLSCEQIPAGGPDEQLLIHPPA